jgi:hypothetical protein
MDFDSKSLTAEEKRMIEARRRERNKSKATRPSRKMDIIDQLDATSIYGTGCMYTHISRHYTPPSIRLLQLTPLDNALYTLCRY